MAAAFIACTCGFVAIPDFTLTGSLNGDRTQHTATLLTNGLVLVAGGVNLSTYLNSAELYDPSTGLWTSTGSLLVPRTQHTAALLPNGKVLVAGGYCTSGGLATAELYDPVAGIWSAATNMTSIRYGHSMTPLNNGKVLVAGGYSGFQRLASCELYDPGSNTWTLTGSLNTARSGQTATLMPDGRVLVAGGLYISQVATAEIYDPATGLWTNTGTNIVPRDAHTATLLPNGMVLVAGGRNGSTYLSSAELYNPTNGTWSLTGSLNYARRQHSANLLLNGLVLVAGGYSTNPPGGSRTYGPVASAEQYDPAAGTWSYVGSLNTGRDVFTATLLPNRFVLVAGGVAITNTLASCELFNTLPRATWTQLTSPPSFTPEHALLLSDGSVLITIGTTAYKLTPDRHGSYVNGTWSAVARPIYDHIHSGSMVLHDGSVLLAGAENGVANVAEVYDPVENSWTPTPTPNDEDGALSDAVGVLLLDGSVLIGPRLPGDYSIIYYPDSNTWSTKRAPYVHGFMIEASWVKLPDDSVLGIDNVEQESERYIPSLGAWVDEGRVPADVWGTSQEEGAGLLLPNGKAMFFGATGHTDLYTPSGNTNIGHWDQGPDFPNGQGTPDAPAAMMVNGRVLCAVSPIPQGFGQFPTPVSFYEYDSGLNTFTRVEGPNGLTFANAATEDLSMLDLPDGTVLLFGPYGFSAVYQPDGTPLASGKPVISNISKNPDGSYHLAGTGLNGISQGAVFGDDAQMDSNYPLVRMTNNATGDIYYARTFNWSSTSVMTGNKPVSTEFTVPTNVPVGVYSVVAVANGIPSDLVTFIYPDVLQLQPAAGFTFMGGPGGPYLTPPQTFTLSNAGATSLNWSVSGIPAWLSLSQTSGSLAPGQPTSVTATLNTTAAAAFPVGSYSAVLAFVNLSDGYTYSVPMQLQIIAPPSVTTPPNGMAALDGGTATFIVTATGGQPLSYQWYFNGTALSDNGHITGSITPTLTVQNVTSSDVGSYSVKVSNIVGTTPAYSAWLTFVQSQPVITVPPSNTSIYPGGSAQFTVTAIGNKPFSYQWTFNSQPIRGATSATLNLNNVQPSQAGNYAVIISNPLGSATSSAAILTVLTCYPRPPGMVAWWRFEGDLLDFQRNYNSTYIPPTGNPAFLPGEVGQALSLDGSHSLQTAAGSSGGVDPVHDPGYSFEGWIYPTSIGSQTIVSMSGTYPNYPEIGFSISSSGALTASFTDNLQNTYLLSSDPIHVIAGQFQHVALTYDTASATATLYLNGVVVANKSSVGPLFVGSNPPTAYQFYIGSGFHGLLDELSQYNRALTLNEIQAICQFSSYGKCTSSQNN